MTTSMKIGDLARAANCSVETVRYYEREDLLPTPVRSEGNYRIYGPAHVEALRFVRHCRSLDMTHDEIRVLLTLRSAPDDKCGEVNALLDAHIGHVARRVRELKALERELKALRSRCQGDQSTRECGIMQSLGKATGSVRGVDAHGRLHRTHG